MTTETLDPKTLNVMVAAQRGEITEHHIYRSLAGSVKDEHNRTVIQKIADEEMKHYTFLKSRTGRDVEPNRFQIWKTLVIARVFGLTFALKLMERGEDAAQDSYGHLANALPDARDIAEDEERHEQELLNMMDEERLKYVGSIVLGLNDALVELTGALAGLTLAFQKTQLIAVAGLITGVAASFSMAASEYLSQRSEESTQSPVKASIYTGIAYICTVFFLIFPYLTFDNPYLCLGITLFNAIVVILLFTFYMSVAKDLPFRSRFLEMAGLSLGVAGLTFLIGFVIRIFLGVEV